MENDVASDDGSLDAHDVTDIFEDDEAVRQVFPEESRVQVELDQFLAGWNRLQVLALEREHRERNMLVAVVRIEYRLQIGPITYLTIVHRANPVLHRHHLVKVDLGVSLEDSLLNRLDLVVECLDLICAALVEGLVQKRNILLLENLAALLRIFFEEAGDSSRMNDLVAWAEGQVQEGRDRHTGHKERLRKRIANVMYVINWISRRIQRFFGPNNPDVLAVVDDFADEGNVLEAEDGEVFFFDRLLTQNVTRLPIERALAEDGPDDGALFEVRRDLPQDFVLCMCWRANENEVRIRDNL